jgi:hypothetical protein
MLSALPMSSLLPSSLSKRSRARVSCGETASATMTTPAECRLTTQIGCSACPAAIPQADRPLTPNSGHWGGSEYGGICVSYLPTSCFPREIMVLLNGEPRRSPNANIRTADRFSRPSYKPLAAFGLIRRL